jgi:hypothetical protein
MRCLSTSNFISNDSAGPPSSFAGTSSFPNGSPDEWSMVIRPRFDALSASFSFFSDSSWTSNVILSDTHGNAEPLRFSCSLAPLASYEWNDRSYLQAEIAGLLRRALFCLVVAPPVEL